MSRSIRILELRAAQGGGDAQRFCSELARAYTRCAERAGWSVELLESQPGSEPGGQRSLVLRVAGRGAEALDAEAGTHRVARQPVNGGGARHTSAVTVAVLEAGTPASESRIDRADIRLETFRASGAGGQHRNKTDSAVRVTHTPTGITAVIADERSQHRNKERALELLSARVGAAERARRRASRDQARAAQVGSGQFAERIRSYLWREAAVVDHRTGMRRSLRSVLDGDFGPLLGSAR